MILLLFFLLTNANATSVSENTGSKSDSCPNGWVEAIFFDMGRN